MILHTYLEYRTVYNYQNFVQYHTNIFSVVLVLSVTIKIDIHSRIPLFADKGATGDETSCFLAVKTNGVFYPQSTALKECHST